MEVFFHSPLTRFMVQAILIMACARLIGLLMRRLDQPMVIAEIVAGILLGPSLLGWLLPGPAHALFPQDAMQMLSLVAQIGLVLFMFLVGLELDPKLLRGRGHTSVLISHTSIMVPFLLGAVLALYLYPQLSSPSVRFSSFTLFMGSAMSITAFPVLARILTERRLLKTKVGAVAITCAAVDDITAWCILGFVVSIVRATGMGGAVRTTGLAIGYIAIMLFGVRPLLARFGARSMNRDGLSQNVVAVTLVLLLVSSITTELIGIHALFGAFMLGAMMPKNDGFVTALAERLEDLVVVFLLPMFFAYSGLRTQIGLLNSSHTWMMCGLIILVACVGKFGGSAVAARITGLSWREASAIGILMNTRGLMELVVINIGLDIGVISPTLFTMLVIMALATTFVTTPLLRWIYPPTELAKELAEEPTPPPEQLFTILMCIAFDRSGPGMVTMAGALSHSEKANRHLYALQLIRPSDRGSFYLRQSTDPDAATGLGPLMDRASELSLEIRPLSFVSPHPSEDICNVAAVKRADLVLLGWHKPVFSRTILGGTVREVMSHAQTDVAVLVDRGLLNVKRVLVIYHGNPYDQAALRLARRLQLGGAVVTVLRIGPQRSGKRDAAPVNQGPPAELAQIFSSVPSPGAGALIWKSIEHPASAEAALEEARQGYDLVLIGIGRELGSEDGPPLFGAQSESLLKKCPTSMLLVHHYQASRFHDSE